MQRSRLFKPNYTFPVKRQKRPYVPRPRIPAEGEQIEKPGIIKGQSARSLLEWWIWQALMGLNWPSEQVGYQVSYFGGQRLRGGQILDFLVRTVPLAQPIYANGAYYHGGARRIQEDIYAQHTLYDRMKGSIRRPLIIWDNTIPGVTRDDLVVNSADMAREVLRKHVGNY